MLAALCVLIGTAISLARTTGAGPFQSIWEEDARDLLTDALARPGTKNLIRPYVGYFQVGPRILAQITAQFPISWAAAVMSIQAALVCALLALMVYVASGAQLANPLARLMVAAPMLFAPTAENVLSEIYNRPATIQFFMVYAVFWLMLWVPNSRSGRITLLVVVALSAVSTFLVVVFIPLALLRLYARRDRVSAMLLGFLLAGAALQVAGLALGLTNRAFALPRYDPIWALSSFVTWALPQSVLGYRAERHAEGLAQVLLIIVPWLIVAAAIAVAWRRLTRPAWLLAAVAGGHAVALACMTIMANGGLTQRYLLPVEMLVFSAIVALLLPSARLPLTRAYAPLAAFTALVLVVSAFNYRWTDTYRADSPYWTDQVKLGVQSCRDSERREVTLRSGPKPWYSLVVVPCHLLNTGRWCDSPYCVQIDGMAALPVDPSRSSG
ncbi:hypothetical protein [Rhizocola hellebori]|nr:hypothetical protein [Rhizocola hellebori]